MLGRVKNHIWTRKDKFLALSLVPVYFLVIACLVQSPASIWAGMMRILEEPDFLITDYMVIGGIGAALFNASILMLVSIGIIYSLGMEMDGHAITSSFLMFGFSLFGKNLFNIWTILLGVCLYARYHRTSLTRYLYVGLYGTSLSPLITQVVQTESVSPVVALFLGGLIGILIGFVLPPLATQVHYAHKGYSLYNVGFAGGIIATVIVSMMKSFGLEVQSRLFWHTGSDGLVLVILLPLFGAIILGPLLFCLGTWDSYRILLKTSGIGGTDYLRDFGFPVTVLNMGINGVFATLLTVLVGGDLNGPTIGGIMTIVGFGSTGKHLRNIFPVMAGVCLASLAKDWNITDPSAMLALLFSTTLAPVAGEFGIFAGILAGILHSSVALHVGIVYGGMNLYNNGFAGGIVAIFLVPVIQSILDRRARARGSLSL